MSPVPRITAAARRSDRERGAMLIIALGVLALMVILGTAFASIMRLEKRATENYVEATRMDMLLDSAVDRVVAQLQGAKNFKSFVYYKDAPWLYMIRAEDDLAHGRLDIEDDVQDRVAKWEVFAQQAGSLYQYKSKIIDTSAQINLNGRQDTLARILDNLGEAIERSSRLKLGGRHVTNPFFTEPNRKGNQIKGMNIMQIRKRLPGGKFSSKRQLKQLIGPENYEIVKDFVCVNAWEDPYTYKPTDGFDEVVDPFGLGGSGAAAAGGGRAIGGGNQNQRHDTAYMPSSRVDSEPRYPICINTAPEEVLIAVIQGLQGRRVFPYSRLDGAGGRIVTVDQNAMITGERLLAKEEYWDVTPRAVFVYCPALEYSHAKALTDRIVGQRKIRPFMTWRTNNEAGQVGFEDFIDGLDASFFPSPANCEVVDTDTVLNRQMNGAIMSGAGASPVGRLWVKGHAIGAARSLRRELGLPMHDQYAWYYDLVKGVIKANFNPNTRMNRYNANSPAFNCVDKSDLVGIDRQRTNLRKGHTTEFTFDTNGIFEITTLGRISRIVGDGMSSPRTGVGSTTPFSRPAYEKKYRTVVQIFDILRHTNQYHFEKSFLSGGLSSKKDRRYVATHPEPMAALTELVTSGSLRDGNVQLCGVNDGIRLEMPPQMRQQFFMNYTGILCAQAFQDRSGDSIARLKRVRLTGSKSAFTDEYTDALRDVFDANISRLRSADAKYLRRGQLQQMGVFRNAEAQWYDPLIGKEVIGTDLFPDGFNMSLLRTSHLQARTLVLPSRSRIGDATGGGNTLVGESGRGTRGTNARGNVPYYRGGLAFWVKFEFDGDDPVFSGLLGSTSVITQVRPSAADYTGSEGTQFFIFKNTVGELRVVRMYYHQAFMEEASGGEGGASAGGENTGIQLYPDPGVTAPGGGGGVMQNPILNELDPKKIVSRSDIVLDVSHFKAHEWHHIALEWDDENPVFPIRLFIDFQDVKEAGTPKKPQAFVDGTANSWVRLNERQPKDSLMIGSIIRDQGVSDAGVFKWFTNSMAASGTGGVKTVAHNVKRILANATIDEFITFEGTFATVKQYYGAGSAPGYFTTQPGEYANVFEIPLPPDIDHVLLRSFDWTSYYPVMYTDSRANSVAQKLQRIPMRCRLSFKSDTSVANEFDEVWRRPTVLNVVAGRKAYANTGSVANRQKAEVAYKFTMVGGRSQVGYTAGGVVGSPVLDDVTLTYFLSSPRVLAQEEDEEER